MRCGNARPRHLPLCGGGQTFAVVTFFKVTEGMVTRIDRRRKQITIRFDNGKTETLRLTDRAAAEAAKDVDQTGTGATKVLIYYSDDAGRKVAHFFKKVS